MYAWGIAHGARATSLWQGERQHVVFNMNPFPRGTPRRTRDSRPLSLPAIVRRRDDPPWHCPCMVLRRYLPCRRRRPPRAPWAHVCLLLHLIGWTSGKFPTWATMESANVLTTHPREEQTASKVSEVAVGTRHYGRLLALAD